MSNWIGNIRKVAIKRFFEHVGYRPQSRCWVWLGSTDGVRGYGKFSFKHKMVMAHRWSYEHFIGKIPESFEIDHLCRRRICVNPNHLEAVTQLENSKRCFVAKTHCKRGHDITKKDNVLLSGRKGWIFSSRRCRECTNASKRSPGGIAKTYIKSNRKPIPDMITLTSEKV